MMEQALNNHLLGFSWADPVNQIHSDLFPDGTDIAETNSFDVACRVRWQILSMIV